MTTKVLDYFSALVADDDSIPLTETALSIAQDAYPDLDLQAELAAIDVLVARLKNRIAEGTPAIQRLRVLNQFFYRELGFGPNANDYYDPENSYLNAVLQSRRGIPISLAVLLMEIGQQIGLPLKGVSFPNHFLVRMSIPAGEVVLDPLTGQTLSKEELQDMLWQRLLAVQQRLVILLPDSIEEVRDRGLAYANLECFRPALEDLEAYVDARTDAADTPKLKERMPTLRAMSKNLN
jgi:regulator of sirC expression with transglutaminase-like and TPR domain